MLLVPALVFSQQPMGGMVADFKIAVLDGEDGVKIIKKKTAVKPVIEVRDKNNLPIAGVAVVIGLGAFGVFDNGAHTATVVTNANGLVTSPEFRPLTKGPFNIQVQATYQGQTRTALIRQTNFKTVADALKAGKTPGSSQANNGSQANDASQASNASQAAASAGQAAVSASRGAGAGAAGGGHGLLIAGIVVGSLAAAGGAAYAEGVIGKVANASSCDISVVNSLTSALQTWTNVCGPSISTSSSCAPAATNLANAFGNYCQACGVSGLNQYTNGSVSADASAFTSEGATSSSVSNFTSHCQ